MGEGMVFNHFWALGTGPPVFVRVERMREMVRGFAVANVKAKRRMQEVKDAEKEEEEAAATVAAGASASATPAQPVGPGYITSTQNTASLTPNIDQEPKAKNWHRDAAFRYGAASNETSNGMEPFDMVKGMAWFDSEGQARRSYLIRFKAEAKSFAANGFEVERVAQGRTALMCSGRKRRGGH